MSGRVNIGCFVLGWSGHASQGGTQFFFFFGNHGLIRRVDDTGRGICGSGRSLETRHGFGYECTAVKFGTDRIVLFWIRVGRRSYDR